MPTIGCAKCKKGFYAKPSWIARGYGKYCSVECQYLAQRTGKIVRCEICSVSVYKSQKDLLASKSKKYFCGKSCQTTWRNQLYSGDRHPNWKHGEDVNYRDILTKRRVSQICKLCKVSDKRLLCVHHKDENRRNNSVANLVWLCYNCHHLVHRHKTKV